MNGAPGPVRTVLLLEPDALQRDLLALALGRAGFAVEICPAADELAERLAAVQPAALLLDTRLGKQSGIDVLEQLQAEDRLGETKVILLSSLAFPEVVRRATQAGAIDFLVKPFDAQLLVARLSRALER